MKRGVGKARIEDRRTPPPGAYLADTQKRILNPPWMTEDTSDPPRKPRSPFEVARRAKSLKELEAQAKRFQRISKRYQESVKTMNLQKEKRGGR